ncbi:hypothetical protein LCGC14_1956200 [marine sediment metagenome]|uniref:FAD/NAD(P)-binding domain-containing protein n=1 Tax=marine sediment metagenome TaxID=412755 RepID=A0A0F9ID48_9ZZZZ
MESYDLVIIGSGAGLNLMNTGLQRGMKVALVEETKIGGTCLTRGCIPSKILVHPADLIREAEHAKKVGLHFKLEKIDWSSIAKRMWEQIDESKQMEKGISNIPNVKLYKGIGEFTGEYEMEVKSISGNKSLGKFIGDRFVLASGARPFIPNIEGIEDVGYVTTFNFRYRLQSIFSSMSILQVEHHIRIPLYLLRRLHMFTILRVIFSHSIYIQLPIPR